MNKYEYRKIVHVTFFFLSFLLITSVDTEVAYLLVVSSLLSCINCLCNVYCKRSSNGTNVQYFLCPLWRVETTIGKSPTSCQYNTSSNIVVVLVGTYGGGCIKIHFKLRSITSVTTKVCVILWSFVVLTWMCDTIELA